jgi:hypothetical protein
MTASLVSAALTAGLLVVSPPWWLVFVAVWAALQTSPRLNPEK